MPRCHTVLHRVNPGCQGCATVSPQFDAGLSLPSVATVLPGVATVLPGVATVLPGVATVLPGVATVLPGVVPVCTGVDPVAADPVNRGRFSASVLL